MKTPQYKAKQHEFRLTSEIIDTSENDDTTPAVRFEITSFGADCSTDCCDPFAREKKFGGDRGRFGAASSLGSLCLRAYCRIIGKRSGNILF